MGHTRGGGIGNRARSYDHTREEVETGDPPAHPDRRRLWRHHRRRARRLVGKTSFRRGSVELNGTTDLFAGGLGTSESPLEKAETVVRHLRISGVSHC